MPPLFIIIISEGCVISILEWLREMDLNLLRREKTLDQPRKKSIMYPQCQCILSVLSAKKEIREITLKHMTKEIIVTFESAIGIKGDQSP